MGPLFHGPWYWTAATDNPWDRILPFDSPIDIRNTRIALGPNCDDASNEYKIPESAINNWEAVPGPGRRLQYTENDDAIGLPYWALPHCAQQTTNQLTGE